MRRQNLFDLVFSVGCERNRCRQDVAGRSKGVDFLPLLSAQDAGKGCVARVSVMFDLNDQVSAPTAVAEVDPGIWARGKRFEREDKFNLEQISGQQCEVAA